MKYSDIQVVVNEQANSFRSLELGISRELLPPVSIV